MSFDISQVVGARVVGFSFPTPYSFELRLLKLDPDHHRNEAIDLLFVDIRKVDLKNGQPLFESKILSADLQIGGALQYRFSLPNGSFGISCGRLDARVH